MKVTIAVTAAVLLGLCGCGSDPGSRAITGGGIGVVGAYVVGAPLLAGAAVGAVAGAATTPERREREHGENRYSPDHRRIRDSNR